MLNNFDQNYDDSDPVGSYICTCVDGYEGNGPRESMLLHPPMAVQTNYWDMAYSNPLYPLSIPVNFFRNSVDAVLRNHVISKRKINKENTNFACFIYKLDFKKPTGVTY